MKRFYFPVLLVFFLLSFSCGQALAAATKTVPVGSFHSIKSGSSIDLYLYQGSDGQVKLEADEDVINDIIVEVKNGVLRVDLKRGNYRNIHVLNAHITFKQLENIKITGSGDVYSQTKIEAPQFRFEVFGSGNMELDMNAGDVYGKITGSGDVEIDGVNKSLELAIAGSGDIEAEGLALENGRLKLTGSGDVELQGSANKLSIEGSSSGDVDAIGLKCNIVDARLNGSGDVIVWVVDKLQASLRGSGDLKYKGSPDVSNVSVTGSGEVRNF